MSLPAGISEGMPVFSSAGEAIGTVQLVYYGGASDAAIERALRPVDPSLVGEGDSDWGAFGSDDVPPEMRARMLREGYVRIEGPGISGTASYVLVDQIAGAYNTGVQLKAGPGELETPGT